MWNDCLLCRRMNLSLVCKGNPKCFAIICTINLIKKLVSCDLTRVLRVRLEGPFWKESVEKVFHFLKKCNENFCSESKDDMECMLK
jgi:hypothetical protein